MLYAKRVKGGRIIAKTKDQAMRGSIMEAATKLSPSIHGDPLVSQAYCHQKAFIKRALRSLAPAS
jgi:hypothetical protein